MVCFSLYMLYFNLNILFLKIPGVKPWNMSPVGPHEEDAMSLTTEFSTTRAVSNSVRHVGWRQDARERVCKSLSMRDYPVVSSTLLSADLAQSEGKQSREKWMGCVSCRHSWKHDFSQLSFCWVLDGREMEIIDSDRNLEDRYILLPRKDRSKCFNP